MRTIQMTLDDELVATVDQVVKKLKTTRSAFARRALSEAAGQVTEKMLEDKHKKGYRDVILLTKRKVTFGKSETGMG